MILLYILGFIYLTVGLIYAFNVLLKGSDPWYLFPINMLGGPVVIVQIYFITKKGKRPPGLRI